MFVLWPLLIHVLFIGFLLDEVIGLIACGLQLELKQKNGLEPIESDIRLPNKDFRQIAMRIQANLGCSPKVVQKNFSLTISGFVRFSFEPQVFNCKVITLEVCSV